MNARRDLQTSRGDEKDVTSNQTGENRTQRRAGQDLVLHRIACLIAFALLAIPSGSYRILDVDTSAADSRQYHFLAVNLLSGRGYQSRPVGAVEGYDPTSRRFSEQGVQTPLEDRFHVAAHRGPVYPLFLAAVYSLHGPRPEVVVRYQAVLAGLTGIVLVLIGRRLWGRLGDVFGVVAAGLLRNEAEMLYAVSSLLTECLAGFILSVAMLCAIWAKRGGALREVAVGAILSIGVLTRQALLPTAMIYGAFLLVPSVRRWRRAAAFALPCALAFGGWTLFLSTRSGGTVVMASTGFTSVLNGLDPVACATANGLAAPQLGEADLEAYWGGEPIAETPGLAARVLHGLPDRLREVLHLAAMKLKIGLFWMPRTLCWCVILGSALASFIGFQTRETFKTRSRSVSTLMVTPTGALTSRSAALAFTTLAGVILIAVVLGYSHPVLQSLCLLLLPAALALRCVVSWDSPGGAAESDTSRLWITAWLGGYLAMTVLTIGVRRYSRPYLPVLLLMAAASIPLYVTYLCGVLNARFDAGDRRLRIRWNGPS